MVLRIHGLRKPDRSMTAIARSFVAWLLFLFATIGSLGCQPTTSNDRNPSDFESKNVPGQHDAAETNSNFSGKERRFRFVYETEIAQLSPGQTARIWVPRPPSNAHQQVVLVAEEWPGEPLEYEDPKYGNHYWFVEGQSDESGVIRLKLTYDVRRQEVMHQNYEPVTAEASRLFLAPNKLVPVGGKPVEQLLGTTVLPSENGQKARLFYDLVFDHVDYQKPPGESWGRGDANWVCDSRFGNCSDFHSLFISLCRSHEVPAMFEIGFPIGSPAAGDIGGYHCWAYFSAEHLWHPVDISEADKQPVLREYYFGRLSPDRIAISRGRDLELQPVPNAGPLNFWVHPHVEVDGSIHETVSHRYRYEAMDD